jgi:hypothetical protein
MIPVLPRRGWTDSNEQRHSLGNVHEMRRSVRRLADGAAAGVVATAVMSLVMFARQRLRGVGTLEPKVITEAALAAADVHASEGTENVLSTVAHVGYGASMGALYGLLAPAVPAPPLVSGPLYGLLIALGSYEGWVPALGILPRLRRLSPPRRRGLVLAHLVYGSILGLLAHGRRPRPRPSP